MAVYKCSMSSDFIETYPTFANHDAKSERYVIRANISIHKGVETNAVVLKEYIPEDSAEIFKVKDKRARKKIEQVLLSLAVEKDSATLHCRHQVTEFIIQGQLPIISKEKLTYRVLTLSKWQTKEIATLLMPVPQRKVASDVYEAEQRHPEVVGYIPCQTADRLMPDYIVDNAGHQRGLIRKVRKKKIHKDDCMVAARVAEITVPYERPVRLMPEEVVETRKLLKPRLVDGAEPNLMHGKECLSVNRVASRVSTKVSKIFDREQSRPSYDMQSRSNPMFEKALTKAIKECKIKEPFYVQVTPASEGSPDDVVIVPKTVFDTNPRLQEGGGNWTLRTPPGYKVPSMQKLPKTVPSTTLLHPQHLPKEASSEFFTTYTDMEHSISNSTPNSTAFNSFQTPGDSSSFTKMTTFDQLRNEPKAKQSIVGKPSIYGNTLKAPTANYFSRSASSHQPQKTCDWLLSDSRQKLEKELDFYKYMLCGKDVGNAKVNRRFEGSMQS